MSLQNEQHAGCRFEGLFLRVGMIVGRCGCVTEYADLCRYRQGSTKWVVRCGMRAGRFWEDGDDKSLRKQGLDGGRWEQGRGMNDISVLFLPRLTYNHATTSDADTEFSLQEDNT